MIFFRTLHSNRLHGLLNRGTPPPYLPLLRPCSSISAASTEPAAAKPSSLYSIFAQPSAASPPRSPKSRTVDGEAMNRRRRGAPRYRPIEEKEFSEDLSPGTAMNERRRAAPRYQPVEEKEFSEDLSPETAMLVIRLHEEGYLKGASFWRRDGNLDPHQVPTTLYSRHFMKSAAEKFGDDHQEIAKWLSASDLKKVAIFGCPSVERKTVFAAKRLRSFFRIQEDIVCRGCRIKNSCKFVNQRLGGEDKVILSDVMRVITMFTLDSVPRQLLVPDELKSSVSVLLTEVVNLSR